MCHTDDSRPPAPPEPGAIRDAHDHELVSRDGTRVAAYLAVPEQVTRGAMVILPDVRGLHPFYKALAERFAEAGYRAIAFDYFGRTAGAATRDEAFDWQAHIKDVTPDNVLADATAALAEVAVPGEPSFTVGFCFGGGNSWRLAATDLDIAGAIGFYGRPALVTDVIDDIRVPLLLLVAGNDAATPLEDFEKLDASLSRAGKEHEMHVYEGAPHSFFDRAFGEWQDACADAWRRIIGFTDARSRS